MFRRSTLRPQPKMFRSSANSARNQGRKGHAFAYIGALFLLSTVAFLHAKSGSPKAAQYNPSDSVPIHRRSATEESIDRAQDRDPLGSEALRKGLKVGSELPEFNVDEQIDKEVETIDTDASDEFDVTKPANASFVKSQDDGDDNEDEEKVDEDLEADLDLDTDEMEELENTTDIAAEGLDDMEEDDESEAEEADELTAETEELERKGLELEGGEINEILEKDTEAGSQDSASLLAVATKSANTTKLHSRQENSSQALPEWKAESKQHEGEAAKVLTRTSGLQIKAHAAIALPRLGALKGVPSWDPLEGLGNVGLGKSTRATGRSVERGGVSLRKDGIIWDHLLGVARRLRRDVKNPRAVRNFRLGANDLCKSESLSSSVEERQGAFSNGSSLQVFGSDDEPLDDNIRNRLEEVTAIEDALLLRTGKSDANKKERTNKASFDPLNPANNPLLQDPDTVGPNGLTRSDKAIWKAIRKASVEDAAFLREKSGEAGSDSILKKENVNSSESHEAFPRQLIHAANSAERSILEVLTKPRNFSPNTEKTDLQQQSRLATLSDTETSIELEEDLNPRMQEKGEENLPMSLLNNPLKKLISKKRVDIVESKLKNQEETAEHFRKVFKPTDVQNPESWKPMDTNASGSDLGVVRQKQLMDSESMKAAKEVLQKEAESNNTWPFPKNHHLAGDGRKWGYFPGIDPFVSFSEFLEQFLSDSRCSLNVFMAWTTPPWTYTVRYQRGLESILHFHSDACIVVFSESIELNFFKSFVEDG